MNNETQQSHPLFSLGERIRELRMKKGMTQIDLSKGICTPSMISQIESDRARPSYKALISIAGKLEVPLEKLLSDVDLNLEYVSTYKMSRAMVAAKEFASAIPLLVELLETQRGQYSSIDILHDLSECYLHTGQFEEAKQVLEQLQELGILRNDHQLLAVIFRTLALIAFHQKHYQLAVYQWQKALEETEKMGELDVPLQATILYNLGLVNKSLGCIQDAISYYERAAELFEAVQNPQDMAMLYQSLGIAYRKIGQFDQAASCFEKAAAIYEAAENQLFGVNSQVQTAALYIQMGRSDEALPMLEDAIQKFRDLGHAEEEGIASVELAKLKLLTHEPDHAVELCQRARNLLPELHVYQGWINRVLGRIAVDRNQREEAIRRYHRAADCFKQMDEFTEWDATMYEIARLHVEEQALKHAFGILDDIRRYRRQVVEERGIVL